MKSVLLVLTSSYLASCLPPPHPAVAAVRREEELLPPHLRKPAQYNPYLQELLSVTSLLHHGEMPVYEREAEKVSRQEIYSILTHAGFVPRRPPHHQPDPHHMHHQRSKSKHSQSHHSQSHHSPSFGVPSHQYLSNSHYQVPSYQNFFDPPFFPSPDLLQHL